LVKIIKVVGKKNNLNLEIDTLKKLLIDKNIITELEFKNKKDNK
jgi:hypothetical protein